MAIKSHYKKRKLLQTHKKQ